MQTLRKALAVHLSVLSLILAGLTPLVPTTSFAQDSCSYPNDQRLQEAQRECTNNPAKQWRCDLNRCINTGEAQNMREDFKKCAEMIDDTARKKCHDDYAKKEGGLINDEKGPNSFLAGSAAAINGANALMMLLSGAGASPGGECISRKIYMGASVVSVLAELYLQFMAKDELEELQKKYEKEQVEEEAHAAQLRALQYLKEEQEAIAKMAKTRATAYTIQLALYAATAVVAAIELIPGSTVIGLKPCLSPEDQEKADNEAEAKELEAEKKDLADQRKDLDASKPKADAPKAEKDAWAKQDKSLTEATNKNTTAIESNKIDAKSIEAKETRTTEKNKKADKAKEDLKKDDKLAKDDKNKMSADKRAGLQQVAGMGAGMGIGKMLGTSTGILIVSGISTGIAYLLRKAAKEQESEANDNAGKVQALIDKFNGVMDSSGYCSPAQRSDVGNPQCYCYEASGDKNMNRTNSDTCQALWAQNGKNYMVGAGNYDGKKNPKLKVCMLINGQVDRACKCRQMINKTSGQNACMKVPMGSNNMGSIGTALGIPALSSTVGSLAGGNSSFGSLNSNAIGKQAVKNRAIADAKIAEFNNERAKDGLSPIDPFSPKLAAKMIKKLTNKQLSNAASASLGNMAIGGRPKTGALANAIKDADSKSGLSKKSFYSGGRSARKSRSSSKGDDFAFLNAGGGGGSGKVKNYMDKKYDYKSNDIVKNKGVSIWKVISSRYSKSAMRRLFSEEGE